MRPQLVINPSTDAEFAAFAWMTLNGLASSDEFERRLRVSYPGAVVHTRQLADEPLAIWYVYRDGRWIPSGAAPMA